MLQQKQIQRTKCFYFTCCVYTTGVFGSVSQVPLPESFISFILERKKNSWRHGNLSHTFSLISPLVGDKVILMNSNWLGGGCVWFGMKSAAKSLKTCAGHVNALGVLCKPSTTDLLVCTRGHLVMDTLSRGTGGLQYNSRQLILKGLF